MTGGRPGGDNLIILTRDDGKRFWLPLDRCRTWQDAQFFFRNILRQYDIGEELERDEFDIIGPDGAVIAPQVWPANLQPGSHIILRMWKTPYDYLENAGPPSPPSPAPQPAPPAVPNDGLEQDITQMRDDLGQAQSLLSQQGAALEGLGQNVAVLQGRMDETVEVARQAARKSGQDYTQHLRLLRFLAGRGPLCGSPRV